MKLLIYSHAFAPQVGGVEAATERLASALSTELDDAGARRFQVTVVTQTSDNPPSSTRVFPFEVVREAGVFRLWGLIAKTDKILLAGPAILPLLFSLLHGKNVLVTHHGYQARCPNGMLFQFSRKTNCPEHFAAGRYRECLRCNAPQEGWAVSLKLLLLTFLRRGLALRATVNVGVSEHVAKRIALPRLRVVRNAVEDRASPAMNMRASEDSRKEPRFAYLGRLVTEKGVNVLLEAAHLLAREGLAPIILIIGDGPERPALEQQKALLQLGANVQFVGFQLGHTLEELVRRVSVLVMPSLCEEVAPLSVLEMMMKGRLIICSRIGGLAEQVGEAGLTFAPGDARELAKQMRTVLENPMLIESLGKSARERAISDYSLNRMIDEYTSLLAPDGRGAPASARIVLL